MTSLAPDPYPVWVLMRERNYSDGTTSTGVLGVYADRDALDARVARIAAANPQYPMREVGVSGNHWVVGPTEDEGFFGNSPVDLVAVVADLWPAAAQ